MPLSTLAKKSIVVIFAYTPAGFGHLRVSDALYHGLPDSVTPLLLGAQDKSISFLYRFISIHPLTRWLMEFFQKGSAEYFFAFWYRKFLQSHSNLLYQQMVTILEERLDLPEVVLVVATHFGLAHQFVEIKKRLEKEKKVRLILIVQVTDDSPQVLWYIQGADAIFVPSEKTKEHLQAYGKDAGLKPVHFFVNPYPVNPLLREHLTPSHYQERKAQFVVESNHQIHIAVPISGAAVDTSFYSALIASLSQVSDRFIFHVVAKNTSYTKPFLASLLPIKSVKLYISDHSRGVVNEYEKMYHVQTIGLEITKPSEQTFKALFKPDQVGGVLLLFSEPVGRQEYDNLHFLQRHNLIPRIDQKRRLYRYCKGKKELASFDEGRQLLSEARLWRGIELPKDPKYAAQFIQYCVKNSVFNSMFSYGRSGVVPTKNSDEIQDDGVELFWKRADNLLEKMVE